MSTLVAPFRGWRYNPDKVGDLAAVLAPPYDVISRPQQAELCLHSPYNIVHLSLGEPSGPGAGDPQRYQQAAQQLRHWQQEQILRRDPTPGYYLYEQQYRDLRGQARTQCGIIGAVELHDYAEGVILPHEGTLAAPKADRLSLLRDSQCALSQIFALYSDPQCRAEQVIEEAAQQEPFFVLTDGQGVRHQMWVISVPEQVAALSQALAGQQIVIADGHHRYETALAYREEYRAEHGVQPEAPAERVSMFLANTESSELTILAAHRLLEKVPPGTWERLVTSPARPFDVANLVLPAASDTEVAETLVQVLERWQNRGTALIVYGPERRAYLLLLEAETPLPQGYGADCSETWRRLDVAVLHELVVRDLLGLSGSYAESGKNISFTRYPEEAIGLVEAGKQEMAILLNPTRVDQVMAIARAGDRMPQKGTYFYPKLLAGIVLYDLVSP